MPTRYTNFSSKQKKISSRTFIPCRVIFKIPNKFADYSILNNWKCAKKCRSVQRNFHTNTKKKKKKKRLTTFMYCRLSWVKLPSKNGRKLAKKIKKYKHGVQISHASKKTRQWILVLPTDDLKCRLNSQICWKMSTLKNYGRGYTSPSCYAPAWLKLFETILGLIETFKSFTLVWDYCRFNWNFQVFQTCSRLFLV